MQYITLQKLFGGLYADAYFACSKFTLSLYVLLQFPFYIDFCSVHSLYVTKINYFYSISVN